ncbi:hypothetical protein K1T35_48290 (plasmid) [Pseudonocardia sp. DSM 110487]|uniref:hypothetical protein n=1 Tax=Pseudonocardia sp. DSM 110487 TaxID=2865833 RepID=UPI001C6A2978|nr:hypothetical protein [Pseudonocardia sp. DSM 110487]QYN41149.1 hypothetical protein K1T35_48290 [Pseudonocardia sp. DSM 110487]
MAPEVPSPDELNGREIDRATEEAMRCRIRAGQYPPGSAESKAALEQAEVMKKYAQRLRARPLF